MQPETPWTVAADGVLTWSSADLTVRVFSQTGETIRAAKSSGLAAVLSEWRQYNIVATSRISHVLGLADAVTSLKGQPETAFFTLRNRVGLATFRVVTDAGTTAACSVLVVSPKLPTEAAYQGFLGPLLADLTERLMSAEFTIEAPTGFAAVSDARGPTPISDFHTLVKWASQIQDAIESVTANPHRDLALVDHLAPFRDIADITPDLILELVERGHGPGLLPGAQPSQRAALLDDPRPLLTPRAEETLDTPPNRFVQQFLSTVTQAIEDLKRSWVWLAAPAVKRQTLDELEQKIEYAQLTTFLRELPRSTPIAPTSQVLLRRPGYRDLVECWTQLTAGCLGILGTADSAVANRDVATLYEVWCFFALAQMVGSSKDAEPKYSDLLVERRGLRYRTQARFGEGTFLTYNRGFHRPTAYSVGVRPDFTLFLDGKPRVVFDAKFRFETKAADLPQVDEDEGLSPEQRATVDDLFKMHTYRDAMRLAAALVVHPGSESVFFPQSGSGRIELDSAALRSIVEGDLYGIGAVALSPANFAVG